ncbi:scamp-domain-containing protein [Sistotremastrum niveocremeum HHB9708]|uniref:Scamp-domain-containing protein n=1 Tax=Sistotremastrum niveocremeum HHB9708 TaxID=1314777 RepID=A0A165AL99_9AGAM|nr:scamp-domain-containing protein [Sistotremastrum niveocremeum HHB9708]
MAAPENPFASTHSLDTNPFDDPSPQVMYPAPTEGSQQSRLDAIARREAELNAREQELNQRQASMKRTSPNNWPFFFPLIYHNIHEEIPESSRALVTRLYQLWLVLLGTLIINLIACIFFLIAGSTDGGRDLGASIMYLPVIGIASFLLWYRPIYNAYMKEQSLYYYLYFFFCGWHILFSIYMIIGIPGTGSAGLIQMIGMYSQGHIVAGVLATVATVGWTIQGLGDLFYFRSIWKHHNAEGHSIQKAKTELATHGAKSYFSRG